MVIHNLDARFLRAGRFGGPSESDTGLAVVSSHHADVVRRRRDSAEARQTAKVAMITKKAVVRVQRLVLGSGSTAFDDDDWDKAIRDLIVYLWRDEIFEQCWEEESDPPLPRTTKAQRPGPRDAPIATGARWPGSLQRMVRRCGRIGNHTMRLE